MKYSFLLLLITLTACTDSKGKKHKGNEETKHEKKERKKEKENEAVATTNTDTGCDTALWKFVYNPTRLQVIEPCKVVTGTITERNADPDGDEHMLLQLDAGQENLLAKRNYKKKEGNLVIEAVCINNITRKSAMGACTGYVNHVQLPNVGEHVRVTGSYVNDTHNGWTEIHPITKIEKM